jgi:MFS family permease
MPHHAGAGKTPWAMHGDYPAALWIACVGALLGSLQYGYAIGVLNTSLTAVLDDLDTDADSLLSSAVVVGAAIGALFSGRLADALGPRRAQLLNVLPFAAGGLLSAAARSQAAFLFARALVGFGAGAASLLTPRYIAEISVPSLRGRIGSQHQVCVQAAAPRARKLARLAGGRACGRRQ